jgi:hypothetical protein
LEPLSFNFQLSSFSFGRLLPNPLIPRYRRGVTDDARYAPEEPMGELTCDDCGTINHDSRSTCELCGESLAEEEQRREERKHRWLAPFAWTGAGIFLFVIFYGGQVWWRARRVDYPRSRASAQDILQVMTNSTGVLIISGLATAVVVGFGVYKTMSE